MSIYQIRLRHFGVVYIFKFIYERVQKFQEDLDQNM